MSLILKYDLGNPRRLPTGYTPLAYIESTGTQLIDTGVCMSSTKHGIIEFLPVLMVSASAICGAYDGSVNGNLLCQWQGTGLSTHIDGPAYLTTIDLYNKFLFTFDLRSKVLLLNNDNNKKVTISGNIQTCTISWGLCGARYNTGNTNFSKTKLYRATFYDNNLLILNLIPAKRNSDGVIGMFDIVSQTFKTNAGTGEFIAGPEVVVLPYEYLQVEYLESIGGQHIDTGVKFTNGGSISAKILFTGNYTGTDFGIGNWTSGNRYSIRTRDANGGIYLLYAGGDPVSIGTGFNILYDVYLGPSTCKINGTNYNHSLTASDNGTNIFLFAAGGPTRYYSKARIYNVKIMSDSSTTVRNMIPCYRRSDLKPGMYDTVNNVFYTNAGSEEFILGPTVEESTRQLEYNNASSDYIGLPTNVHYSNDNPSGVNIPGEYQEVLYLESSGTQYIKTGVKNNELIQKIETNWKVVEQAPQIMFGCYDGTYYTYIDYCESSYQTRQYLYRKGVNLSYYMYAGTEIRTTITRSSNYSVNSSGYTGSIALEDATPTSTKEHYLFAYNNNGSPAYYTKGQLREFKLWTTTGGLVRNFVPCYRKSDNKPGMYDTVNGVFYTNAGTGEFICGPNVYKINLGSGNFSGNSYINIGTFLNGTSVKNTTCCMWLNPNTQSGSNLICGSQHGNNQRYYIGRLSAGYYGYGTAGSGWANITDAPVAVNTWQHIALTIDSSGIPKFYYNGVLVNTRAAQNYNFYGNFQIGCANNNESYFNGKIYDFRIYNHALTADEVLQIYKKGV